MIISIITRQGVDWSCFLKALLHAYVLYIINYQWVVDYGRGWIIWRIDSEMCQKKMGGLTFVNGWEIDWFVINYIKPVSKSCSRSQYAAAGISCVFSYSGFELSRSFCLGRSYKPKAIHGTNPADFLPQGFPVNLYKEYSSLKLRELEGLPRFG